MLALEHDEAHLWLAECACGNAPGHINMLSHDERNRAAAFASSKLADEFVTSRATLRSVLAAYLGQPPAEIAIVADAHGKPMLAQPGSDLTFNLSHSGDWLLIGVADGRRIGVDIQIERSNTRCLELARRFFAEDEAKALEALDPTQRLRRFFALWTLKEAYLKATGQGISGGLHRVRIAMNDGELPRLLGSNDPWRLHQLDVGEGYAAAVAVAGMPVRVRCGRWRLGVTALDSSLLRNGFR